MSSSVALPTYKNSTNVRSNFAAPAGPKTDTVAPAARLRARALNALAALAPGLAARVAERAIPNPPPAAPNAREQALLAAGASFEVRWARRRIRAWTWGDPAAPAVLLVHGWGGHSGQFASFVPPLLFSGLRAVAFDLPGHGADAIRGAPAALPDIVGAIRAAARAAGPVHGVLAHSLGSVWTSFAILDGLRPQRAVFIAPPSDREAFARAQADAAGVGPALFAELRRRDELRYRARWSRLKVSRTAKAMTTPLLVVHDRDDRVVPIRDGEAYAQHWPGARFHETRGLGHNRILRAPEVVHRAIAFLHAPADLLAA
jgi:pimeloyl-ACP methyl ester carboxylesterase